MQFQMDFLNSKSKNRTKALEEILDDVECQRNTRHSQIKSKNQLKVEKKKRKIKLNGHSWGRFCGREAPNLDTFITPRQFTGITDINASPDVTSEYTSQPNVPRIASSSAQQ